MEGKAIDSIKITTLMKKSPEAFNAIREIYQEVEELNENNEFATAISNPNLNLANLIKITEKMMGKKNQKARKKLEQIKTRIMAIGATMQKRGITQGAGGSKFRRWVDKFMSPEKSQTTRANEEITKKASRERIDAERAENELEFLKAADLFLSASESLEGAVQKGYEVEPQEINQTAKHARNDYFLAIIAKESDMKTLIKKIKVAAEKIVQNKIPAKSIDRAYRGETTHKNDEEDRELIDRAIGFLEKPQKQFEYSPNIHNEAEALAILAIIRSLTQEPGFRVKQQEGDKTNSEEFIEHVSLYLERGFFDKNQRKYLARICEDEIKKSGQKPEEIEVANQYAKILIFSERTDEGEQILIKSAKLWEAGTAEGRKKSIEENLICLKSLCTRELNKNTIEMINATLTNAVRNACALQRYEEKIENELIDSIKETLDRLTKMKKLQAKGKLVEDLLGILSIEYPYNNQNYDTIIGWLKAEKQGQ